MGACALLPRIVGQGRASELLYTGRFLGGEEAERWGFHNRLVAPEALAQEAAALAHELAHGPTFAHAMTKTALHQEWAMGIDEAIEAEAQTQALCMQTRDFAQRTARSRQGRRRCSRELSARRGARGVERTGRVGLPMPSLARGAMLEVRPPRPEYRDRG
jgi:enoyl-CoA hydratase/carnithine racemase